MYSPSDVAELPALRFSVTTAKLCYEQQLIQDQAAVSKPTDMQYGLRSGRHGCAAQGIRRG